MDKIAVISTNIKSAGWEEGVGMEITFTNGTTYQYKDCPKSEFEEMVCAESVGKYFNTHIRLNYEGTRVK